MMSRRVRAFLGLLVAAAFLGLACLAHAYSITVCQAETGEWWITLYDNATGQVTGVFHGIGGHVCPAPSAQG